MADRQRVGAALILASPMVRAAVVMIAVAVAVYPMRVVLEEGPGFLDSVVIAISLSVTGILARGILRNVPRGTRMLLVVLAQFLVLAILLTLRWFSRSALLGIIPTPTTLQLAWQTGTYGVQEMVMGIAPLRQSPEVLFLLMLGAGILTICVFACTVSLGLPLVAAVAMIGVGSVPPLIVGVSPSFGWILTAVIVTLVMLWQRQAAGSRRARSQGLPTAILTGAAVVAASLTFAPTVSPTSVGMGAVTQPVLNPTVNLGSDLRRPAPVTALTFETTALQMPYLRIATHTEYTGTTWRPDADGFIPVTSPLERVLGARYVGEVYEAHLTIGEVQGNRFPIPHPTIDLNGLSGQWQFNPLNGTVTGNSIEGQSASMSYVETAIDPELLRTTRASGFEVDPPFISLPDTLGQLPTELMQEVTAGATTDFDRLLALETWFRTEFTYSLDAPVIDGFDGADVDMVTQFLEVREGYCTHFASAFAIMARTIGIPTRVVVGFLPGERTSAEGNLTTFTVMSDQMHAWPEVFFEGVGWVPFEPTATLGEPMFSDSADDAGADAELEEPEEETPEPTPEELEVETPEEPEAGSDAADEADDPVSPASSQLGAWLGRILTVLAVIALLCAPAVVRVAQRNRRIERARAGDAMAAMAAWRELEATATDYGIDLSGSDRAGTIRARAEQLTRVTGISAEPIRVIRDAAETALYGGTQGNQYTQGSPAALDASLRASLRELEATRTATQRVIARALPRSLFTA